MLEIISLYRGNYKESTFYLRQISRLSKIPLKTCQNALVNLENARIIKSKIEGRNKYFMLNLDNIITKSYLLQAEIYKTNQFLENYPKIKLFLKSINTTIPIIIFGSFAKLKADKNSDLDMLIISEKELDLDYYLIPYTIHKINISKDSFNKAIKKQEVLIKEIEENHIILNNHSFYVITMWKHYEK